MQFYAHGLLVLLHVLFASLWFGGAVYQVRIIGGTLMQAGPLAGGFLAVLARRRGIGWYFALMGGLTLLFGAWLYGDGKYYQGPFDGGHVWITSGAIVAVLAYLHGALVNLPLERKWMALSNSITGQPTPQQATQMQEYGMRLGKAGALSAAMIGVAILLMLLSRVFI